ncbi:MAG: FCD domain-containing protein, partial [Clostridia bacterium]
DQLTETIISGIRGYIMEKKQSSSDIDEQHRQLVDAIVRKDAKLAEQRMSEHMETIEAYMNEMEQMIQL